MTSEIPRGERLRQAIRWISARLDEDAERPRMPLVNEATLRFDLTPAESEYLIGFYRKAPPAG